MAKVVLHCQPLLSVAVKCCAYHACVSGVVPLHLQGRFSPGFSMPQIIDALEKAAVDPRIKGIAVEISPLAVSAVDNMLLQGCHGWLHTLQALMSPGRAKCWWHCLSCCRLSILPCERLL